ncbi:techylectin-5A-like [Amblyomma americanum]
MTNTLSIANAENRLQELAKELANINKAVRPRHCTDLLNGGQRTSGLYNIFPVLKDPMGTAVYCDMQMDGGGWTVIQKRGQYGNNAFYFYRNWTEYAKGFGDPAKEYWIATELFEPGNRVLHALTSLPERMELRVVLRGNDTIIVDYENIKVENEARHFMMKLGRFLGPLGWWYNNCHYSNLNGLNLNGPHASIGDGIQWELQGSPDIKRHYHYSFPSVQMMVRPDMAHEDKLSISG